MSIMGDIPSVALKDNGVLWTWGDNNTGALGDGTGDNKSSPIQVIGNHLFTAVASGGPAGKSALVALKSNGAAWSWGRNFYGQLGTNNLTYYSSPVPVIGNHSFIKISTGTAECTAGIKANGEAWAWGENWGGNVGNNTSGNSYSSPVLVVGNHSFVEVMTDIMATYYRKDNGEGWSIGRNDEGRLGDNTTVWKSSPVLVVGNHSFSALSSPGYGCGFRALKSNGQIWNSGMNGSGGLGDNTTNYRSSPVLVVGNHNFVVASNYGGGGGGIKTNNQAWMWGSNVYYMLGAGINDEWTNKSSPVIVIGNHAFTQLSGCDRHKYALKASGEVWSWGDNYAGALGDNTTDTRSSPVLVVGNHSFANLHYLPESGFTPKTALLPMHFRV